MTSVIVHTKHEAIKRLDMLGLKDELLQKAVGTVYTEHLANITHNEPPISHGMTLYLKGTGKLREVLQPLGWRPQNKNNHARTISPDESMAIVVAGGNECTGLEDTFSLSTRSRKGKMTQRIITINQLAFDLKDFTTISLEAPDLWFLLIYVDKLIDEIRIELSMPRRIDRAGFITDWRERIIIPLINLRPEPIKRVETSEEIDIDIHRRIVGDYDN